VSEKLEENFLGLIYPQTHCYGSSTIRWQLYCYVNR